MRASRCHLLFVGLASRLLSPREPCSWSCTCGWSWSRSRSHVTAGEDAARASQTSCPSIRREGQISAETDNFLRRQNWLALMDEKAQQALGSVATLAGCALALVVLIAGRRGPASVQLKHSDTRDSRTRCLSISDTATKRPIKLVHWRAQRKCIL